MTQDETEVKEAQDGNSVRVMLVLSRSSLEKLDAYCKREDRSRSSAVRYMLERIEDKERETA